MGDWRADNKRSISASVVSRSKGWSATVVHDAAAAQAVFHHVRAEVLVLDVNLPGISGLELLELLRHDQAWQNPPIIFISAAPDQPEVRDRVISDGIA